MRQIYRYKRNDVDAIFTALCSPRMSDARNPKCPFPEADAVSIWMSHADPDEWIPVLCDELKKLGYSITPNPQAVARPNER